MNKFFLLETISSHLNDIIEQEKCYLILNISLVINMVLKCTFHIIYIYQHVIQEDLLFRKRLHIRIKELLSMYYLKFLISRNESLYYKFHHYHLLSMCRYARKFFQIYYLFRKIILILFLTILIVCIHIFSI